MSLLSARLQLKQATQPEHDALEALPCHKRLLKPDFTIKEYANLLMAYWRALSGYDRQLAQCDHPAFQDYLPRSLSLAQDLQTLGFSVPSRLSSTSFNDIASLWGVRYVFEGMTLGGQVLMARAPILLGNQVSEANAFFSIGSQHWPAFCHQLESGLKAQANQQRAISAARQVMKDLYCSVREVTFPTSQTA